MVPAGNKAKRFSSVSHATKTIHHHHNHHHHHVTFLQLYKTYFTIANKLPDLTLIHAKLLEKYKNSFRIEL